MARKKIRKLLISTMTAAMLGALTLGVADFSANAAAPAYGTTIDTSTSSTSYFWTEGGSYLMYDTKAAYTKADGTEGSASSGVKMHVTPTEAGGDVKLTLKGAHTLYSSYTSAFRYRLVDSNASAVIATYRSSIDSEYAISFITTTAGTYVSFTDDVEFKDGVPYVVGSDVAMDIDLTATKLITNENAHTMVDFRPVSTHKQYPGSSLLTKEMFKEIDGNFSTFLLTDENAMTEEKTAVSEEYAYRYTTEWITQLLSDLSFNDNVLELTFVDVKAEGTVFSILQLNEYNYAEQGGWGATAKTAFQAPAKLLVQTKTAMKFNGSTDITNLKDYYEVWDYTAANGKTTMEEFTTVNVYKNANYDYAGKSEAGKGISASTCGGNGVNGYNVFRPGLILAPTAYYYVYTSKKEGYPAYVYGRFDIQSKMVYTVDGGSEQTTYVTNYEAFHLADYEEFSIGCPNETSATWTSGGAYAAGTSFGATDTILVGNNYDSKIAITSGAHTEEVVPGYPATSTSTGLTDGSRCSVCGRVLSVGEEIPVLESDKNFWADGGTVKLSDPNEAYTKADGSEGEASVGVKMLVKPSEGSENVTLTLKGAHQRYVGTGWWGGSLRYRMEDMNAGAVIATYRSNVDQEYAISFIMTSAGTYVSLTDDIELIDGVPYAAGSSKAMDVDLWGTKQTDSHDTYALVDFRPTTSRAVNAAYSTTQMFKEVNGTFSSFNLTNESMVANEKEAAGDYAYRYTTEWIEQMLYDLSYNDSILELTFMDVAEEGTIFSLLELNGYNYADAPKNSWNSEPVDTFQAPRPLIVQKTTEMHITAYGQGMELDSYWEVWDVDGENGKDSMPQRLTVSGTNYDTTVNTYTDTYSTQKGTSSGLNYLLSDGSNIFRPGLMNQSLVYYRLIPFSGTTSEYTTIYGRINVKVNVEVTVNGVTETLWVPAADNWTLSDFEWDGCPTSATGNVNGTTSATAKTVLNMGSNYGGKLTVTLGEHDQVQVGAVAAGCTTEGKTAATVCSVCDKIFVAATTIPATGHNEVDGTEKAATLIEDGHTAGTYCSTCNEPIVAQEVIPSRVDGIDFNTPDVASARISEVSGLRFTTYIEKAMYDELIAEGHTLTFYTEITTINSTKKVTIAIDNAKIYESGEYYCFNSVLGEILSQNYTRIFFADSYMIIDNDVKTIKALTVDGREGRSYAQIITAVLNDVSDTQTETATYNWDGKWYALAKSAYEQAQGINTTINGTEIKPVVVCDGAEAYADEIKAWFASKSFKIGDVVDFAGLIDSLTLPENQTLDIAGEGANGIVTNRGLNLTISVKETAKLIDDGASEYTIVYGSDVTSYHAEELQENMSKSMKKAYSMPVQADNGSTSKAKVISIGSTAYAAEAGVTSPEAVGITKEDGFVIKSFGDSYIIYGGSSEGSLYGVYEFLRQMFGMEFLTITARSYYPANEFVYAKFMNLVSNPVFDTRDYYGQIVSNGYASTEATFGFNSPNVRSDGRITGSTNENGDYNAYGGQYFRYYYGTEDAAQSKNNQIDTASTSPIGHTVGELLAASASKEHGFTYGEKVDVGGGNMWMKGYEEWHPEWYAKDPNYETRIEARNKNATDMQITLGSVPNQIYESGNAKGRAALEICWTNGLNDNLTYTADSTNASGSVIEKLIEICMKMINDGKNAEAVYLELGFYDWYVECQCDNCLKAYQKFGGKAFTYTYNDGDKNIGNLWQGNEVTVTSYWGGFGGAVANTVNQIAKACKAQMQEEGINREVKFVTLGYQRAIQAPTNLTLDDDVCVRMCYRNCATHPVNADSSVCTENQAQLAAIEAWKAITSEILIWDYTIDFTNYLYYMPNYDAMKANYQYYQSIDVTQVMTQSAPWEWNFYDSVLHQYVASKLMWDTTLDVETIIQNFNSMYFGDYAEAVEEYRELMDNMYKTNNIHANTWGVLDFANNTKFDAQTMKNAIDVLEKAIAEATEADDKDMVERLTSVIIQPKFMLVDMGLVEGEDKTTMKNEVIKAADLLSLSHYNEGHWVFTEEQSTGPNGEKYSVWNP